MAAVTPTLLLDLAGTYALSLVVNDGKASSTASAVTLTAEVANAAPVANAGPAQSIVAGSAVTLDGSTSPDANGDVLTYAWTLTSKPGGSTASLGGANSAKPTFTADIAGNYVASLVVNDGSLSSAAASVTVTAAVANVAPVANAGVAQNVSTGSVVTLDGSTSSDANGDALTYGWTLTSKPAGSTAVLSSSTSAKPTFTADAAGSYVASLTVNDGKLSSAAATVIVSAAVADVAPVANAGVAQQVVAGAVVVLDGTGSSDANGDVLSYVWILTSKPATSVASLSSTTASKPTFTSDIPGVYVATLTVNDGRVSSAANTVTVTATPAMPAVIAGNVYIQDFPSGPFNLVNLATGALTSQLSVACGGISAATVGLDGVALGTRSDGSVVQFDPVSGKCLAFFTAPEWIDSFAAAPDGTYLGQSQQTFFGAKQIYRFSATGAVLSKVALGGVGSLGGLSFAPNGQLYGVGFSGWFRLDPITASATLVSGVGQLQLSEVCIDSVGIAYGHSFGVLYRYNAVTGVLLSSLTLQRDLGLGAVVCR